jgi:hypothetical protein
MDGPGTYSQPPYAGGSKDESGTAAKDTISIGSGDRVSGADRMGMEVHTDMNSDECIPLLDGIAPPSFLLFISRSFHFAGDSVFHK